MLTLVSAPTVCEQPCVTLLRWRIYEVLGSDHFLVGHVVETGRERVTTPVVTLDVREMRATSSSGRLYVLEGGPDKGNTAAYVWHWWSTGNTLGPWRDVTDDIWAKHRRAGAH